MSWRCLSRIGEDLDFRDMSVSSWVFGDWFLGHFCAHLDLHLDFSDISANLDFPDMPMSTWIWMSGT